LGECAEYPEGAFDYGQVDIGTCLAGPTALAWIEHPSGIAGESLLVVANANPFQDFTGGSLLAIDGAGVPQDGSTRLMHELSADGLAAAASLPSFAGGLAWVEDRNYAAVTVRYSEGAEDLEQNDYVWMVDLSEPSEPQLAKLSAEGTGMVEVEADPIAISYDPGEGLGFVTNVTSESVSVVDMLGEPVELVDAMGRAGFAGESFVDSDDSGSNVLISDLDVTTVSLFPHDEWTLTFSEGRFRLWVPSLAGVYSIFSSGQDQWTESALGVEVTQDDTSGAWGVLGDPQIWVGFLGTRMALADTESGNLVAAALAGDGSVWAYEANDILTGRSGNWDASLSGPMVVAELDGEWLFYDGNDEAGTSSIGVAYSEDGLTYRRVNGGEPVLGLGSGQDEGVSVADPFVVYDAQSDLWRMYYSAYDGEGWATHHAVSADLVQWTADAEAVLDGVASPVVVYSNGQFRLWGVRFDGDAWSLVSATSVNGTQFTEAIRVDDLGAEHSDLSNPPGVGLTATLSESWSVSGENRGLAGVSFQAGTLHTEASVGWRVFLSAGAHISEEILDANGVNGLSASTWLPENGWVYGTWTDANNVPRIGLLEGAVDDDWGGEIVLEGRSDRFDGEGVSHPVVFETESGWSMLYAGQSDGITAIGLATSLDGWNWEAQDDAVLAAGEDWDALAVRPGSVTKTENGYRLYYTGSNGVSERVGVAESSDGVTWSRLPEGDDPWFFGEGSPGSFDDSSVADPMVLDDEGLLRMWYSGFDGERWSIGYAESQDGVSWVRTFSERTGEARAVLEGQSASFDQLGAFRPVVVATDDGWSMLYTGVDAVIQRVGLGQAIRPDRWYRDPAVPTTGDEVRFESLPGDKGGRKSIRLEQTVDGFTTSGAAITASHLDEKRGFLYLASAASAYIYVVDIRDDSTPDWTDNLFEIEAVLVANVVPGGMGFRGMVAPADSPYLYAVNDNPESIMIFDVDAVEDDHLGDVHLQAVVAALPAARGAEVDEGADTLASVGPSTIVVTDDRLFVANFNANSVGVYDRGLGPFGTWTHDIKGVGENPHAMALSPDGRFLAVASIVGELDGKRSKSRIVVVDTESLEIVGWIANESR